MSDEQKQKIRESLLAHGKPPTKRCPECGATKDRAEFGVRKNGHSRATCRPCDVAMAKVWREQNPDKVRAINRRTSLKRWFGITPEQYDGLLAAQDGRGCAVCGGTESTRNGYLFVDHCHRTGRIRGLLCGNCNAAIGMLRDDPTLMRAAAAYVERPAPADALHARPGMPCGQPKSH